VSVLRDRIGQILSTEMAERNLEADWCDSREIDRLADAVIDELLNLPSIREMLLEELVRKFMAATTQINGEEIASAHETARKLLRIR
jgi:hypothetical protein